MSARFEAHDARTDAKIESVVAKAERELGEAVSQIASLGSKIDSQPKPPSIWQIAGVVAAGVGGLIAIAAFSYDRFGDGLTTGAIVDATAQRVAEEAAERDRAQAARIERLLEAIESQNERSSQSSAQEQD